MLLFCSIWSFPTDLNCSYIFKGRFLNWFSHSISVNFPWPKSQQSMVPCQLTENPTLCERLSRLQVHQNVISPPSFPLSVSETNTNTNRGCERIVPGFFPLPGICYHSWKVRNISLVSFSITSSFNHRRPVLFNVRSIIWWDCFHQGITVSMFVLIRG